MTFQMFVTGPAHRSLQLGDLVNLKNGLELTLIYCEDKIPIYRTGAPRAVHEMWTEHMDRPRLHIRVGDWHRPPGEVFDTDEAIERALTARNIAEKFFAPMIQCRSIFVARSRRVK